MGLFRLVWYLSIALGISACAAGLTRNAVPLGLESDATVVGMGGETVRFWGDALPPNADAMVKEKWTQVRNSRRGKTGKHVVTFLAISGGGADGAFGAGVLTGWTERGDRPEFDVVTGVSTGALTAPFAFLGPQYDEALRVVLRSRPPGTSPSPDPCAG